MQVKEGLSGEVTFERNPKWGKCAYAKGMARHEPHEPSRKEGLSYSWPIALSPQLC